MTEGAKNNYSLVIKLDLTLLALVPIFLRFSVVFVTAEEDYKTDKQKQCIRTKRVDDHLCLRVLSMLNSKIN